MSSGMALFLCLRTLGDHLGQMMSSEIILLQYFSTYYTGTDACVRASPFWSAAKSPFTQTAQFYFRIYDLHSVILQATEAEQYRRRPGFHMLTSAVTNLIMLHWVLRFRLGYRSPIYFWSAQQWNKPAVNTFHHKMDLGVHEFRM